MEGIGYLIYSNMKKTIFITLRSFLFLLIAFLVSWFFYTNTSASVKSYYSYTASELLKCQPIDPNINNTGSKNNKEEDFKKIIDGLENTVEKSDIKLFKNYIGFDIFVENNFAVKDANTDKNLSTRFNIAKDSNYIEVSSGQKRPFLFNLSFSELKNYQPNDFEYKLVGKSASSTAKLIFLNNESIKFYIELSKRSFFMFFIISLPITWGILLLIDAIIKFVICGRPFTKKEID